MKRSIATGATVACLAGLAAAAQPTQPERRDRPPLLEGMQRIPAPATGREIAYGADPLQTLDFHASPGGPRAPLVVFVHGGGWKRGDKAMMNGSAMLVHFQARGYAVASVNYRLVPAATVEDQARDVAQAVARLKRQAGKLGFDPERMMLAGHSAGAHLVALVGTDPQWLRGAGLDMDAVRGILPLDGAGYYAPDQMDKNRRVLGDTYTQAFGTDVARQKRLSPTLHTAAPNAPAFLILHVAGRPDAKAQSEALAAGLRAAGTPVELRAIPGAGLRGHMEIARRLGEDGYPATPIVDAWLTKMFDR